MSPTNQRILHIAIPSIISNITVPLLGLVDVTIVGHLGSASYIGAIAVGGMLFNMIYWIFGFLRMGTSGLTAQAYGAHDLPEVTRTLLRSLGIGIALSLALLVLQYPIRTIDFHLIDASPEVRNLASLYFHICIWGAPATLGLYGFTGWFIGMQNSRFPMYIALTQNVVNIIASLFFVFACDMKVAGVALGTLIAQYAGLFMAYALWLRYYRPLRKYIEWKHVFTRGYVTFLPSEPRYFPSYTLLGGGHRILHLHGSGVWRCDPCRQHFADATFHPVLLHHGRICIRRRSFDGKMHRGTKLKRTPPHRPPPFRLGHHSCACLYSLVRHRRKRFPWTPDQRTNGRRSLIHLFLLGACHPVGRILRLFARWHLYRSYRHGHHVERHVHGIRWLFPHLLWAKRLARQPCPMARIHFLPRFEGHSAGMAGQTKEIGTF